MSIRLSTPEPATPAMNQRIRVAVLFGGRSAEHSVSCVSGKGILSALDPTRFETVPIGVTKEGTWRMVPEWETFSFAGEQLPEVTDNGTQVYFSPAGRGAPLLERTPQGGVRELAPVDVFFPVMHGPFGEDGTLQGLLDLAGVPYVGPGVFASAASMDKHYMKGVLREAGIPTADWVTVSHREFETDPAKVLARLEQLSYPAFVKPARAGSSVGISKVKSAADYPAALHEAFRHDSKVIVEPGINGREVECSVLGSMYDAHIRTSAPGEITVGGDHEFYDFEAKYLDASAVTLTCPAVLPAEVTARVQEIATAAFRAFDCTGLTRVDTFVTSDGQVLVNELNTSPGFTPTSGYPFMWQNSGLEYTPLLSELIDIALQDRVQRDTLRPE